MIKRTTPPLSHTVSSQKTHNLIFKCDTGTDTSVISKTTYMSLTRDYNMKHLDPPDGPLKEFGSKIARNLDIAIIQVLYCGKS